MPRDVITLADLSDEAPCGDNLEFDADFGAMERSAQGKPETQYGDTVNPATPPEWKDVEALAASLLERTRDIRILTHLAVARLHLQGLARFADVLTQIRQLIETRWEQLHPHLDPEDDLDPTLRANALFRLCDPVQVLRPLRIMPLAVVPHIGSVSWRDIAVLRGALEPEAGAPKLSEAALHAVFAETNQQRLRDLRDAVETAASEVAAIPRVFEDHAGPGTGPDFTDLAKLLRDIQKELRHFEAAVPSEEPPATEEAPQTEAPTTEAGEPVGVMQAAPVVRSVFNVRAINGVSKRDDALYLLELAATYFRTHEPSSPVPLLIDRARRLGEMDFLDILRDLAPDGVNQAENIFGRPPEQY